MAVPWLQIVQLVPSILDVSRELLKRSKSAPAHTLTDTPVSDAELAARIAALEENERRQAELVSQIAEQLAVLARAVNALHRQVTWLTIGLGVSILIGLIAAGLAAR
jgi:uncharacterized coiled-coil protein SlyX